MLELGNVRTSVRFVGNDPSYVQQGSKWWNGRLLLWDEPRSNRHYVLGIDPGQGRGKDRSVIEVLQVGNSEEPDIQVAEFASDAHGPMELSEVASAIGRLFGGIDGEALAVVECNSAGGGDVCLFDMHSRWGYNNFYLWKTYDKASATLSTKVGWWTTKQSRPKLVMRGVYGVTHSHVRVNSLFLLREMQRFQSDYNLSQQVALEISRVGSAHDASHDDRVMAFLMAFWGAHDEEWIAGEDVNRQRLTPSSSPQQDKPIERKSWQNTAISAEDMAEAADAWIAGNSY